MKSIKCKKLYCLFAFLEIILLVMISGWYYFSERKMGMIRHILFRNVYKFPKYFTDTNVKLLIAIFVVFLIIQLLLLIRTRKYLFSFILNTLFIGLSIYFILNNNSDKVFIHSKLSIIYKIRLSSKKNSFFSPTIPKSCFNIFIFPLYYQLI